MYIYLVLMHERIKETSHKELYYEKCHTKIMKVCDTHASFLPLVNS